MNNDTLNNLTMADSVINLSIEDTVRREKFTVDDLVIGKKEYKGKEGLFYLLISLLLFFAFLNRAFPKYFNDLYRLFFRTTLNQSQIREQMIQSPLPSLLLNIFFVITGGLYLGFIFRRSHINLADNFWLLFLFCCLGLLAIYIIKYFWLKISGWLFHLKETTENYIFIVFLINKMVGIFLLPILIILAFTSGDINNASIIISYTGLGAFMIYRSILSYSTVRKQININPFHFILYFFAFEIIPLLVIYKVLLVVLNRTA